MRKINVLIRTTKEIEEFHKAISDSDCKVDARPMDFKKFIDAKSFLGLWSLDLSQPIHLEIIGDEQDCNKLYEKIKCFEV